MNHWPQFCIAFALCMFGFFHLTTCLPVTDLSLTIKSTDLAFESLKKEIAVSNTPSRVTKLFRLKNSTEDQVSLSASLFSELMRTMGWSKVEKLVPMYWTNIVTIRGPFQSDKERTLKCQQITHPDHFMSNVVLENIIKTQRISHDKLMESITKLLCGEDMKQASLHFVQSDDVISGIVIVSIQKDSSVISLANIGF